jgi:hypothetical protein
MNAKSHVRYWILAAMWLGPLADFPYVHASENMPKFRCDAPVAAAQFVMSEIRRSARAPAVEGPKLVELTMARQGVPQSYRIERDGSAVRVVGADTAGLIYGGLDVAEAIRLGTFDRKSAHCLATQLTWQLIAVIADAPSCFDDFVERNHGIVSGRRHVDASDGIAGTH